MRQAAALLSAKRPIFKKSAAEPNASTHKPIDCSRLVSACRTDASSSTTKTSDSGSPCPFVMPPDPPLFPPSRITIFAEIPHLKNVASLKFVASHALVINGGRRVEARGVGHLVEYLTAAIRKRDAWPLNVCSVFRGDCPDHC